MKFLTTAAVIGTWALGTLVSGLPVESESTNINVVARDEASKYEPYPSADWFKSEPKSPVVTAMGERLEAENCSAYEKGSGPQWTDADRESYQKWQEKLGYQGDAADGWPGKESWDKLNVPNTKGGKKPGDGGGGGGGSGHANKATVNMLKQWEGFKPNYYDDGVGKTTIGYGHNCDAQKDCGSIDAPITKAEGTKLFQKDLRPYEKCVCGLPNASELNENQFGALISYAYNSGCGGVSSTWHGAMKEKNFEGICEALPTTNTMPGTSVHVGLKNRRAAESELCSKPSKQKSGC